MQHALLVSNNLKWLYHNSNDFGFILFWTDCVVYISGER